MDVISIIPARGGSLGVKEKNLQTVNGKTLVEIAVNASKSCSLVKETFVSSDAFEATLDNSFLLSSDNGGIGILIMSPSVAGFNPISAFCICLLYTSPSPRDLDLSRMPSSA